jgi:hypothetical protein
MVFGSRADHARSADVDVLDGFLEADAAAGDSLLERVEVDAHQVDRANVVLFHCGNVLRVVAQRQQAAMDLGVQRLDPAVHHFRETRHFGHVDHRQPRLAQEARGASGADQFHVEFVVQRPGKGLQAGFVGNGQQCATNGYEVGHALKVKDGGEKWKSASGVLSVDALSVQLSRGRWLDVIDAS